MAVHIKCSRPFNIEALQAIMERCGGRGPSPPRCPPMRQANSTVPRGPCSKSNSSCTSPRPVAYPQSCSPEPLCPVPCMTCPPMAPIPPCSPCPFTCPPCTGYPCVTCAPLPKPVPAPYEPPRPVVRTPINCGGLFYTGTTVCYPCLPPVSPPKCLPYTPIPGILPPYKHTRNPCLQSEDEPLIPSLAGAPLITHRCVQEKRRTSDQRVARLQNIPGIDFEYVYVPTVDAGSLAPSADLPSRKEADLKPEIEDLHYQRSTEREPTNLKFRNRERLLGGSGDPIGIVNKDINGGTKHKDVRDNGAEKKFEDYRQFKDADDDAKSTCSRRSSASQRSSISHCSRNSHRTDISGKKSQRSQKRCESKDSHSRSSNAVPKISHSQLAQAKYQDSRLQKFGRIANGLDEDDLIHRRR